MQVYVLCAHVHMYLQLNWAIIILSNLCRKWTWNVWWLNDNKT